MGNGNRPLRSRPGRRHSGPPGRAQHTAQAEAVSHDHGPLLIIAGAGSGKTRFLTNRIAWLIAERGVSPFEILAITFTNKVASEMKSCVAELVGPVAARMGAVALIADVTRLPSDH